LWVSPSSWVLNVSRNIPRLRVAPDCWKSLQEVAVLRRESVYCRTRHQRGGVTSAAAIAIPKSAMSTLQVSHAPGTVPPPPHTPAHTAGIPPQQRQAATRITGSMSLVQILYSGPISPEDKACHSCRTTVSGVVADFVGRGASVARAASYSALHRGLLCRWHWSE
jgi:hypothetical protein